MNSIKGNGCLRKAVISEDVEIENKSSEVITLTALERASLLVIDKIREMSPEEVDCISIFPPYVVSAACAANDSQVRLLGRTLAKCVTVAERHCEFHASVDRQLSDAFTLLSYSAFFEFESPAKIEHRLALIPSMVKVDSESARRVGLKRVCSEISSRTYVDDTISSIFLMGGRHSTVESLLDFEPILREKMLGYQETKYAFNRNDWMQYPGTNRRGQICCVRESDQMGFFSNKFWEQISSGSDVLAAARSAYSEVLNYYVIGLKIHNDDMLSIDAFVKTLLHDELSDESIDELEERSA